MYVCARTSVCDLVCVSLNCRNSQAAQEMALQRALKNCSEEARGGTRYIGVLQQRLGSWEYQKITIN